MANATDYLEQQIFNHIFRDDTFTKPSVIAIGLTLDVPVDSGNYLEVADSNGYARYYHASGDATWGVHNDTSSNSIDFEFATATGDWGTVSGVIITDNYGWGSGNVLMYGALTTPRVVANGDTFKFSAGNLDVTIA